MCGLSERGTCPIRTPLFFVKDTRAAIIGHNLISMTPNSNTQHFAHCSSSWQHMFSERNLTGQPKLLALMLDLFAHRSNMFNCPTRRNNCRTAFKCCSKLRFLFSRCDFWNSIRSQLSPTVANICLIFSLQVIPGAMWGHDRFALCSP